MEVFWHFLISQLTRCGQRIVWILWMWWPTQYSRPGPTVSSEDSVQENQTIIYNVLPPRNYSESTEAIPWGSLELLTFPQKIINLGKNMWQLAWLGTSSGSSVVRSSQWCLAPLTAPPWLTTRTALTEHNWSKGEPRLGNSDWGILSQSRYQSLHFYSKLNFI